MAVIRKILTYQRYCELQRAERLLQALEELGVDNWEGYCDAVAMTDGEDEEPEDEDENVNPET